MECHLEIDVILGENPRCHFTARLVLCIWVSLFDIGVTSGGSYHRKLNMAEVSDSKQVPWGKIAKYSEKRVKQNWNRVEVSGWTDPYLAQNLILCIGASTFRTCLMVYLHRRYDFGQLRMGKGWIQTLLRIGWFIHPVLKHGPRSLVYMRVKGL